MTVVEVSRDGVTVHPPNTRPLPAALVEAALTWIDDPVGLLDDRPVPTAEIWRSVLAAAVGRRAESLLVVHPDDWTPVRVRRVVSAAGSVAARVVAVGRASWAGPPRRRRRLASVATVLASVATVLAGVGATVLAGVGATGPAGVGQPAPAARSQPGPAVVSLVEGPVAVLIPADWTVQRRSDGPGPPRVRVGSPADPAAALTITWSYAPQATLAGTAAALRRAVAAEPAGVFEFLPDAPAGRPAVAYRETRPGRVVRWWVLLDGATRIAVGCQSAPEREAAVRQACDRAVASARDIAAR